MSRVVPEDRFAELTALADVLLAKARDLTAEEGVLADPGAPPEFLAFAQEGQAFTFAVQALCRSCPLEAVPMFTALGGAIGSILGQDGVGGDPRQLWHVFTTYLSMTFADVQESERPKGTA